MLNRRSFLKAGLTTGAAIPVSAALTNLDDAVVIAAGDTPAAHAALATPNLVALPPRLAPANSAKEPWRQKVRLVGQSNMSEHFPAVKNNKKKNNNKQHAQADLVFISVTGILAFYPSK